MEAECICIKCGKSCNDPDSLFCPYCGERMQGASDNESQEVERIIRTASDCTLIFDRARILREAEKKFPENRRLWWEKLFLGEISEKRRSTGFFSIRCYNLQVYLEPRAFSKKTRQKMRDAVFNSDDLNMYRIKFGDDPDFMRRYLYRLCREFIDLFLVNSRYMQNLFGIRYERDPEKHLSGPVTDMIYRIRKDADTEPVYKELLEKCLYQAFSDRFDGKTEALDRNLK